MINMIKNEIEDIKDMLNTVKNQILNIEDEIENIDNNGVVIPSPVPNINCCSEINDIQEQINSKTELDIVDNNGTVVGELIGPLSGLSGFATVLELNNKKYVVIVRKSAINGAFGGVLFANNDCTGQAYLDKGASDLVMVIPTSVAPANATIDPTNETLYEADLNNQVNATFNSTWSPNDHMCLGISDTIDLYIANPVFDLSTLFEPPYKIQ